jgi:hypothetical protein
VPLGPIEQRHGMLAGADHAANLGQVQVHRRGVAQGQDQGRALAFARADGTEDGCGRIVAREERDFSARRAAVRAAEVRLR